MRGRTGNNGGVDNGVGATLREARNRRKIDLSEVEAATKIRVRYLRAIENEEWELLPGDAYARGFVRTYAAYLGLDAERLAEQQRRSGAAAIPAERLPRVDPTPAQAQRRRPRASPPPRLLAVAVSAILVAILVAVGLSSGGGDGGSPAPGSSERGGAGGESGRSGAVHHGQQGSALPRLRILASAEVWVCLLGGNGEPLLNGQILAAGEAAGPFQSGSFTLAMGNGAAQITVDGRRLRTAESSSPVGYAIDRRGRLTEIPAGERPTCT